MENLDKIQELLEQAKEHADKLYNKNTKNAAPKLRKVFQELKALCTEGRKEALDFQKNIGPKRSKGSKKGGSDDASGDEEESDE